MKRVGAYENERIGVIDPNLSPMIDLEWLIRGEVILFKDLDSAKSRASVIIPIPLKFIEGQENKGTSLYASSPISVPIGYIRPIGPIKKP